MNDAEKLVSHQSHKKRRGLIERHSESVIVNRFDTDVFAFDLDKFLAFDKSFEFRIFFKKFSA